MTSFALRRYLVCALCAVLVLSVAGSAAAFAPFDSDGFAAFRIASGAGEADVDDVVWTAVETAAWGSTWSTSPWTATPGS